jgi:hypothetical protein
VHARHASLQGDLRNLRDTTAEALHHGDAACAAVHRPGARPARELGDRPQRTGFAWRLAHHCQPAGNRVLSGRLQQLIYEAFDGVAGVGVPDRAPPEHRHTDVGRVQVATEVGDVVRDLSRALDRARIDAVLDHCLEG